jgi:hypothetical protein
MNKQTQAELNGDGISGLPHPLAAETTAGSVSEIHKILKKKTLANGRK